MARHGRFEDEYDDRDERYDRDDRYDRYDRDEPDLRRRSWDEEEERGGRRRYRDADDLWRAPPHSGMGIASSLIGLGAGLMIFVLIVVAGILAMQAPNGRVDEKAPEVVMVGLGIMAGMGIAFLGGTLGVVGLTQRDRNKLFAILGLCANGLILLGTLFLICAGMAMG